MDAKLIIAAGCAVLLIMSGFFLLLSSNKSNGEGNSLSITILGFRIDIRSATSGVVLCMLAVAVLVFSFQPDSRPTQPAIQCTVEEVSAFHALMHGVENQIIDNLFDFDTSKFSSECRMFLPNLIMFRLLNIKDSK